MAGYYFNLPQIAQLTISQQAALNETRQIALSGGPGTGKSVVLLWLHISDYQMNKKSLLLTFTTALAKYLSACCTTQNPSAANNVKTSLRGKPKVGHSWHEIIVDEAQDLPISYYNDIKSIANVSYGADDSQILYPDDCSKQSELKSLFNSNENYVLDKNFRSTQRIMQFAKVVFPNAYIPKSAIDGLSNNVGELPVLLISGRNEWNDEIGRFDISNSKQDNSIIEVINQFRSDTHNIAILVPFKGDAQFFETVLNDNNVTDFSIYYDDRSRFQDGCSNIKNVHITTFKSAKGLEFDTVIIPNFHNYQGVDNLPKHFHLKWQDYYVAITRARSNLYLISNNDIPQLNSVTDKSMI
ncbi:MAG: ATP-binding domain-containing protein [Dysgonamonadaceae bacterium]|jgi:DNA helicase IV|nr:ATP-binding domain-containing protein [Dysgonamonadaceae bacterium]